MYLYETEPFEDVQIEIVAVVVEAKNCIQTPLPPPPFSLSQKSVLDAAAIYHIFMVFGELYRSLIVNFMGFNFT